MPESVREQIIKKVYEQAALLTPMDVERCRRVGQASRDLFISVWDGLSTSQGYDYNIAKKSFQIGIEASWIAISVSEEANEVMAMIEMTMAEIDFGDLVDGFNWQTSQPFYPDTGESNITSVRVTYDVQFSHQLDNPFILSNQE